MKAFLIPKIPNERINNQKGINRETDDNAKKENLEIFQNWQQDGQKSHFGLFSSIESGSNFPSKFLFNCMFEVCNYINICKMEKLCLGAVSYI